ncbi:MAG: thiamine pyrophosphate-dependent enzyme, partial [Candidatus Acidiferrales bacterium]
PRARCDREQLIRAAEWIRSARRPIIVAGGGVIFSDATEALAQFAEQTGIPVGETQAGKGSLRFDHPQCLGAIGVTGTPGANIVAREADLVIGIGTRYADFTTASNTAFQNPAVRFVNINVAEFDAYKRAALPLIGDARTVLAEVAGALESYHVESSYAAATQSHRERWEAEVDRIYAQRIGPPLSQAEVIGVVNEFSRDRDVMVCAAGSLPGDLHKLWRTRDPKGYHMEYGNSCMGYEIAGGLGVKMAAPDRDVYVMVGDGSYLMMGQEIVTAVQEGYKLNIVLIDNHGFSSIGGLSRALGNRGMGTDYKYRRGADLAGDTIRLDLAANAASLGAHAVRARTHDEFVQALQECRDNPRTSVVVVETAIDSRVPGYESWWDVPVAEVSEVESVQKARKDYEKSRQKERNFF